MGSIHSKISNHRKPKFHRNIVEKIRKFPLHDAIRSRNHTSVKKILKQDVDIVNSTDDDGVTPLMVAAIYGQLQISLLLHTSGADIHKLSKNNYTALSLAAREG